MTDLPHFSLISHRRTDALHLYPWLFSLLILALTFTFTLLLPLALTVFMVIMTNFLLLIGAGLFSKSVWAFQTNEFNKLYVALQGAFKPHTNHA